MRLIGSELHKVWTSKRFLTAFSVLLCINLALLWIMHISTGTPASAYRKMTADLADKSQQDKAAYVTQLAERCYAYRRSNGYFAGVDNSWIGILNQAVSSSLEQESLRYTKTLNEEYAFLLEIQNELEAVESYDDFLLEIEAQAGRLSGISIFQQEQTGFDMANIRASAEAYQNLAGVQIDYYPQKGLQTATGFRITDWLLVGAAFFLAAAVIQEEKEKGLLSLIGSTPNGKMPTAFAKIMAIAISLFAVVAVFYGANLLMCGAAYGLGDMARSIQSVPFLMQSVLRVNVLGYLGLFLTAKWIALFIIGMTAAFASLLFRRSWSGYLSAVVFLGVNLLIRSVIPATSRLGGLKYANCVSLLDTNELLGAYFNINVAGRPVSRFICETVSMGLFLLVLMAGFISLFVKGRRFVSLRTKCAKTKGRLQRTGIFFRSVCRVEWFKFLSMNGALMVLALYAIFQVYSGITNLTYIAPQEIRYRNYMEQLQGDYSQESYEWLCEKKEIFAPLLEIEKLHQNREITEEEYTQMLTLQSDLVQELDVYGRVVMQDIPYAMQRKGAKLLYGTGYSLLFDLSDEYDLTETLLATIVLILCFSDSIAKETGSGMLKLLKTTPLGRGCTMRCKLRICLFCSVAVAVLSLVPRYWQVIRDFGLSGFFYPACSLTYYSEVPRIFGIFFIAIAALISRVFACLCISVIVMALSAIAGKPVAALAISTLALVVPGVVGALLVPQMKYFSAYSMFHFSALCASGLGPYFLTIAVFAIYGYCAILILREKFLE